MTKGCRKRRLMIFNPIFIVKSVLKGNVPTPAHARIHAHMQACTCAHSAD